MLPRTKAMTRSMLRPGLLAALIAAIVAIAVPAFAQSGPSYYITVNTSSLAGQSGYIAYELLPNAGDSPALTDNLNMAYNGGYSEDDADVAGFSSGDFSYSGGNPASGSIDNNQITGGSIILVPVTFGSSLDVLSALSGPGFLSNAPDGSTFSIDLYDSMGNGLLTSSGDVFEEDINGSGGVSPVVGDPADVTAYATPESSSLWLLFAGIAAFGLFAFARRRGVRVASLRAPGALIVLGLAALAISQPAHAQAGTGGTLANDPPIYNPAVLSTDPPNMGGSQNAPLIGSNQPGSAHPALPVPTSTPIRVDLPYDTNPSDPTGDVNGSNFEDFQLHGFTYPGPPGPGPWAKIVLVVDFNENSQTQYDRSELVWIGNCLMQFGTTPEPSLTSTRTSGGVTTTTLGRAPAWEEQVDVTRFWPVLSSAKPASQCGVECDNAYYSPYLGLIECQPYLLFYPADSNNTAATTPNVVASLTGAPYAQYLYEAPPAGAGSQQVLTYTGTFPKNSDKIYAELWTENQNNDEFFWAAGYAATYPATESAQESNPYQAIREAEVQVDGSQAGSQSCFVKIFSGGTPGPSDWVPSGDVYQYNFSPQFVDLTPLAGLLNDGRTHTVTLSVFNQNQYWAVAGELEMYTDPVLAQVNGTLTADTATLPNPVLGGGSGTSRTLTSNVNGTLDGYLDTYQGWQHYTVQVADSLNDARTSSSNNLITDTRTTNTTVNALFAPSVLAQNNVQTYYFHYSPQTSSVSISNSDTYNSSPLFSSSLFWSDGTLATGSLDTSSTTSSQIFQYSDSLGNVWNENTASASAGGYTVDSTHKVANWNQWSTVNYGGSNTLTNSFASLEPLIPNDFLLLTN